MNNTYPLFDIQYPISEGNFWTSKQRQGHSLHEISYRACFKPQLVEYFIKKLTQEGDIVLDPFMGRGTTVLQAHMENRIAYGSDVNPLSQILTEPRLRPPSIDDIEHRLQDIPKQEDIPDDCLDLLVFFHEETLRHLLAMKKWFVKRIKSGHFDSVDSWIRMVTTNRLTGHSPGFLSVKTMPPNQAVSIQTQKDINQKYGRKPTIKNVADIVIRKSKSLLRSGYAHREHAYKLDCCRAEQLNYVESGEVDLVLTSPPFLDVVDYVKDNWLRCWFCDIDTKAIAMDVHRDVHGWCQFIRKTFTEFTRVVKTGGYVAFEVGDVRNGEVNLDELVVRSIEHLPFGIDEVIINIQNFTKTANCWGVRNNTHGTLTNRIVIARRL